MLSGASVRTLILPPGSLLEEIELACIGVPDKAALVHAAISIFRGNPWPLDVYGPGSGHHPFLRCLAQGSQAASAVSLPQVRSVGQ